ncbi:hypothetical protein EYF80_039220 [Liparis tanakae]|uniref:Uncharacterized protein n=1 Tax=Liparis tanakae TaxID=230148 RepID=A0A4Z2GBG8_9TELE|nr:hypothetical protein EYF80_039220 [Liparis tanakae]
MLDDPSNVALDPGLLSATSAPDVKPPGKDFLMDFRRLRSGLTGSTSLAPGFGGFGCDVVGSPGGPVVVGGVKGPGAAWGTSATFALPSLFILGNILYFGPCVASEARRVLLRRLQALSAVTFSNESSWVVTSSSLTSLLTDSDTSTSFSVTSSSSLDVTASLLASSESSLSDSSSSASSSSLLSSLPCVSDGSSLLPRSSSFSPSLVSSTVTLAELPASLSDSSSSSSSSSVSVTLSPLLFSGSAGSLLSILPRLVGAPLGGGLSLVVLLLPILPPSSC